MSHPPKATFCCQDQPQIHFLLTQKQIELSQTLTEEYHNHSNPQVICIHFTTSLFQTFHHFTMHPQAPLKVEKDQEKSTPGLLLRFAYDLQSDLFWDKCVQWVLYKLEEVEKAPLSLIEVPSPVFTRFLEHPLVHPSSLYKLYQQADDSFQSFLDKFFETTESFAIQQKFIWRCPDPLLYPPSVLLHTFYLHDKAKQWKEFSEQKDVFQFNLVLDKTPEKDHHACLNELVSRFPQVRSLTIQSLFTFFTTQQIALNLQAHLTLQQLEVHLTPETSVLLPELSSLRQLSLVQVPLSQVQGDLTSLKTLRYAFQFETQKEVLRQLQTIKIPLSVEELSLHFVGTRLQQGEKLLPLPKEFCQTLHSLSHLRHFRFFCNTFFLQAKDIPQQVTHLSFGQPTPLLISHLTHLQKIRVSYTHRHDHPHQFPSVSRVLFS